MRHAIALQPLAAPPAILRADWLARARARDEEGDEPLLASGERAALQRCPWFAALPTMAKHDLLGRCEVRRYAGGEMLHTEGTDLIRVDAVAAGAVGIAMRHSPGAVFHYLQAGTWFPDPAMFAGGARRYAVHAQGRTTIVSVSGPVLAEVMGRHFGLEQALLARSHELVAGYTGILEELCSTDLATRLARCLSRLATLFGVEDEQGTRIALELTQTELAVLLRASRARINLNLKELERLGLLVVGRELVVRDLDRLASLARG